MGSVRLGFNEVGIFDKKYDRGIWENTGHIYFKGKASLGHGTKLSNTGIITLGKDFLITAKSELICQKEIEIGDNVLISWDSLIMDTDFHEIYDRISHERVNENKKVTIGNHVWIGCRCVLLKGCEVKDNSIIAANSTVSKVFSKGNIIIGGINKIIKSDVMWNQ